MSDCDCRSAHSPSCANGGQIYARQPPAPETVELFVVQKRSVLTDEWLGWEMVTSLTQAHRMMDRDRTRIIRIAGTVVGDE